MNRSDTSSRLSLSPAVASAEPGRSQKYPATPWSAQRLYRPFVRSAFILSILLGFATGSGMLVADSFGVDRGIWWITHAQAHGMAQIFGFTGLFTMGISFHVVPRFRNGRLRFPLPQRVALYSVLGGVILRFSGQSIDEHPMTGLLVIAGGILLLIGALIYVLTIFPLLRAGDSPAGPVERWIHAAMFWFVTASAIHLALGWWLFDHEASIAPFFLSTAVTEAGLYGFVGSFIMGVSTRAVSGFLGLRPVYGLAEKAAFVLFHGGLTIAVFSRVFESEPEITAAGRLIMAVGIAVFVVALRVLEPSTVRRPPISPGAYSRFGWFIRPAYAWLAIGAGFVFIEALEVLADATILPAEANQPVIHIVTMGFATSMVIGMGCRMIPLFEGSVLPGHRLLDAAFALLSISVVTRTFGGFIEGSFADALTGIAGTAGLLAVVLGFVPIYRSMRESARERYRSMAQDLGRVKWTAAREE